MSDDGREWAVRQYQEANGLKIDGIAGPNTLNSMGMQDSDEKSIAALVTETGERTWDPIKEAAEGALDRVKGMFGG